MPFVEWERFNEDVQRFWYGSCHRWRRSVKVGHATSYRFWYQGQCLPIHFFLYTCKIMGVDPLSYLKVRI